jgi:ABC-type Fe3+-hydroxamate transport system substrate-binding protein
MPFDTLALCDPDHNRKKTFAHVFTTAGYIMSDAPASTNTLSSPESPPPAEFKCRATLVDAAGVQHRPATGDVRIVSLVPSLTELLFDLGIGDRVVGRTAFCVHPRERVKRVLSVGGTKTINMQKLRSLAPTHVVVNIDETPRALAQELADEGVEVIVTHPVEVADNPGLYRLIGGLFRAEEAAEALAERFHQAYALAVDEARGMPSRRVLYLIWRDPWMTVSRDTYISRMLALVNWHTVPAEPDRRYPTVALDDALLDIVDRVLFASEPFPFKERHIQAFRADYPRHAGKAAAIDGELVSWYGSRAIAGLGYITALARSHA